MLDNEQLERVSHTKFLGLYIDEYLEWNHRISHCTNKKSSWLYEINSAEHILSKETYKYYTKAWSIHIYLAPGGGCEVLFSPGLSVCVCVSVCLCVHIA